MIKVTVGLPIWDSGDISWLAIESLCRQETSVPWELLICEEEEGQSTRELITKHSKELQAHGCISITTIKLQHHVPLSYKYRQMYKIAKGGVFMMQGADDWSHKNRIQNAYDAITSGADWFQSKLSLFYHLGIGKTILFDHDKHPTGHPCAPGMSWRTDLMRHLPDEHKASAVDWWLFQNMTDGEDRDLVVAWEGDDQYRSLFTHGANKISKSRGNYFVRIEKPFVPTDINGLDVLPPDIAKRLEQMLGYGI